LSLRDRQHDDGIFILTIQYTNAILAVEYSVPKCLKMARRIFSIITTNTRHNLITVLLKHDYYTTV